LVSRGMEKTSKKCKKKQSGKKTSRRGLKKRGKIWTKKKNP